MVSPVAAIAARACACKSALLQSSTATPTMGQSSKLRRSSRYSDRKVITLARSPLIPKTTRTSAASFLLLLLLLLDLASS